MTVMKTSEVEVASALFEVGSWNSAWHLLLETIQQCEQQCNPHNSIFTAPVWNTARQQTVLVLQIRHLLTIIPIIR